MTQTPTRPAGSGPRPKRRWMVIIVIVLAIALVVAGLVAGYLFFFGSPAPDAPSLDDALKVLRPSASPS